jgi:hypothetical protein
LRVVTTSTPEAFPNKPKVLEISKDNLDYLKDGATVRFMLILRYKTIAPIVIIMKWCSILLSFDLPMKGKQYSTIA